jgi:hypothetical protein
MGAAVLVTEIAVFHNITHQFDGPEENVIRPEGPGMPAALWCSGRLVHLSGFHSMGSGPQYVSSRFGSLSAHVSTVPV